jgi:hypothetical protein
MTVDTSGNLLTMSLKCNLNSTPGEEFDPLPTRRNNTFSYMIFRADQRGGASQDQ